MRQHIPNFIIAIILVTVISGCVQLASDEVAPTQVAVDATWTAIPSETPTEEATLVAQAQGETAEVTEEAAPVEPTEPALSFVTETPIPTATDTPTDTPTVTPSATATATPTPTLTEAVSALVQEGTAVAQEDAPPLDDQQQDDQQGGAGQITDFEATATALIENATQTQVVALTETAIAITGPTATPTPPEDIEPPTLQPDDGNNQQPPPVQPGQDCIHQVRVQDQNLYRLALAYGVRIRSITNADGTPIANPDLITIGQRLRIPGCGTTGGRPPATSTPGPVTSPGTGVGGPGLTPPNGDCSWGTTVQFPQGCPGAGTNTSGNLGTGDTGTGTGGPGTTGGRIHIVDEGETLSEIALQYGTTADAIAAANGLGLNSTIFFNQELIIP